MSALPAEHAVCFAIVTRALAQAREEFRLEKHLRKVSPGRQPRPSFSVDLRSKRISSIPLEAIELIKDEVERLALAHNQLTSLQDGFSGLHRMRYLNLRANLLGEFPAVITRLPSLEILDVSHNQIGSLPEDFGTLMSLKVLSMGKNKITVLPNYIGAMPNLTILKLHHNPIVFPPKDLLAKDDATDDEVWLEEVKRFLRQYAEKVGTGSESSSDYGPDLGNDSCSSINTATFASRTPSPGSVNSCCCSVEGSDTNNNSNPTTTIITTTNQAEEQQKEAPFRLSAELDTIMPHASNSLRTRSVSPSKRSMLSLHQNRSPSPLSNATILSSSAPMPAASSLSPSPSSSIASEQEQPQTPLSESNLSQLERSRSHSESTAQLQTIRGNRRMGMLPPRKSPNAIFQGGGSNNSTTGSSSNSSGSIGEGGNNNLRTVVEQPQPQQHLQQQQQQQQKASKHQRGYSHDSIIDSAGRTLKKNMGKPADGVNGGSQGSPTEKERQPGPYFRRLSSLPENKRTSLSSARVGEAARGILYAMSTLQKPIEHFVQSAVDPNGPHHKVERALYNGNIHIGSLVGALEAYEEKDDEAAVDQVIDACYSCVAAFRQVLSMLQSSSKEIGAGAAGHDVRYMRTLLLTVYGSYVEIQSSYEILRPLLRTHRPTPSVQSFSSASSMMRGRQPLQINNNPGLRLASIPSATFMSSAAYTTPRGGPLGADYFSLPPTPGLNSVPSSAVSQMSENGFGFDHDEPLYGIFQTAIGAALSTLPVIEKEIKAALGQSLMPNVSLKLRQVSALCVNGADAARKLSKVRWEAIQEGDVGERRRFWDDTNIFTKLIINIAELIKSTHQEYTFRKNMLTAVGMVVRPTKDLYILLNGSSFRMYMAESSSTPNSPPSVLSPTQFGFQSMVAPSPTPTPTPTMTAPQTWLAATPLSAALGPAAQATLPQGMFYPSPGLGGGGGGGSGSGSNSRSATLMSMVHPTMTSVMSGLGGAGIAMAMPVTPSTPGPEGPMGLGMGLMTSGAARGGVGASSVSLRMG